MPVRTARIERASLTEAALCAWVSTAAPGDRLAYHRGFLAWDLAPDLSVLSKPQRAALNRVASRARLLYEQGRVHLVQRREGPGDYTYLMIAWRQPRPQSTSVLLRMLTGAEAVAA
ncbi:hypothetical protein [Muricoccus aerilatus]|uniref:hypothetical protein n=1 Tax=Muricoccus aerilatus TaxID=452982 RepID=UPI000693C6C9|nr:hypothetical protein [Roseomonas aerilata]